MTAPTPAVPIIDLHATMPASRANGPGLRFAIWFQGCSLGCPGCFNPATHPAGPGSERVAAGELAERIAGEAARTCGRATSAADRGAATGTEPDGAAAGEASPRASATIEGVTISGGEPFEQPEGLLALVRELRRRAPALSILVFSGFTRAEIERQPLGPAILGAIDVLVDGRFVERRLLGRGLRGSDNQRIHLLSERYSMEEIEATPAGELLIEPDGTVRVSGVAPVELVARPVGRDRPRRRVIR